MVQFLSIIFFFWISSIFVGFFKSSVFLCHSVFEYTYDARTPERQTGYFISTQEVDYSNVSMPRNIRFLLPYVIRNN